MTETQSRKSHRSKSILLPSILSLLLGTTIVLLTSPTVSIFQKATLSDTLNQPLLNHILTFHALITDLTFIFLISFLLLCNRDATARWIACNQSFPYSYSPAWNVGPKSFDFQLLIFEIFHVGWVARTIHMVGIVVEEGLWAMVVYLTFGKWGLLLLFLGLGMQGIGYGDSWVSLGVMLGNAVVIGSCWCFIEIALVAYCGLDAISALNVVKGLLFWIVTVRTLSHTLEPLPPAYQPEVECFDSNFGVIGWKLCLSDLPRALWLVILGNVSEFGAGMPGRLFNVVVYKCMYKTGFRSQSGLLDVSEAKSQAWQVIEGGWIANPETAKMYQWASSGVVCSLQEGVNEKACKVVALQLV